MIKIALPITLCVLLMTGCTTSAHLGYTPIYPVQDPNDIPVYVTSIEDVREDGQEVGALRNLLGMPIVKIVTEDNVPEWVSTALEKELAQAGYTVTKSSTDSGYEIEGRVLDAYSSTYLIYHGHMSLELTLRNDGAIVFQKQYDTNESGGLNWVASAAQCMNTLELNLQEICKQFITDLNQECYVSN